MTEKENLLVVLAEECAEVQQATTKSLRFGLDNHGPDAPMYTNEHDLLTEYHQLVAVMEMLCEHGIIQPLDEDLVETIKAEKKLAVRNYMAMSRCLGRVVGAGLTEAGGEDEPKTIYTHEEAADICEMFEGVLDRYDITIPSPEDDDREEGNGARLYGSVWSGLQEDVEARLVEIIGRVKNGEAVVQDEYGS